LSDAFWYPQVLGLGPEETDSIAGQRARLYVFGESNWELRFIRDDENVNEEMTEPEPEPVPEPEPESPPPAPEPEAPLEPAPEPLAP
ncbi:MAG TPA: hypothetical protein VER03_24245, partial [Bryobacteraceae bacterium]|nr:hypothetical protein [Bryobacteraceae bacterium]